MLCCLAAANCSFTVALNKTTLPSSSTFELEEKDERLEEEEEEIETVVFAETKKQRPLFRGSLTSLAAAEVLLLVEDAFTLPTP